MHHLHPKLSSHAHACSNTTPYQLIRSALRHAGKAVCNLSAGGVPVRQVCRHFTLQLPEGARTSNLKQAELARPARLCKCHTLGLPYAGVGAGMGAGVGAELGQAGLLPAGA